MRTQLTGALTVAAQGVFSESSTALHNIGEFIHSNDGRGFRYCHVGGTALVGGKLYQASAEDTTNHQAVTVATNSIGDTTVTTTDSITISVNEFANGFMSIQEATTGAGFTYKIKSNTAASGAVATFVLDDPISVATTGTTKIDVNINPYKDIIIGPQTETSSAVGFAVHNVTEAYYGWLCVMGPTTALAQGTVTVGDDIVAAGSTADGTVAPASASTLSARLGYAVTGIATTEYGLVYAQI